MKIGNLDFKDYAAKKPLLISPVGEFVTADEIVAAPALALGSVFTLDIADQLRLALARYEMEPEFKLGIFDGGVLTKQEVVDQLKAQTNLGRFLLQVEMGYVNDLLIALASGAAPTAWPEVANPPIIEKPDIRKVGKCVWLKLPTRALFCENTTDPVTTPFANYRIATVHAFFKARGFTVVVLQGAEDVRTNFVPQAKNGLTVYLSGIGHGAYTLYTGHWGDRILEACTYDAVEVKDKAIHFLSCQTAAQLGPNTITKGAKSYAGYTENFILQWDNSSTPVDEFLLFAKSDSVFDLMMANGATAQQAYDGTIQAFNAAISQVPNTAAASYLTWDRDHLKLHGQPETKIQAYRYVKVCFPFKEIEKQNALIEAGVLTD